MSNIIACSCGKLKIRGNWTSGQHPRLVQELTVQGAELEQETCGDCEIDLQLGAEGAVMPRTVVGSLFPVGVRP